MIQLHPEIYRKDGEGDFVLLPYAEFLALQEALEDAHDAAELRRAIAEEGGEPSIPIQEVRRRLGAGVRPAATGRNPTDTAPARPMSDKEWDGYLDKESAQYGVLPPDARNMVRAIAKHIDDRYAMRVRPSGAHRQSGRDITLGGCTPPFVEIEPTRREGVKLSLYGPQSHYEQPGMPKFEFMAGRNKKTARIKKNVRIKFRTSDQIEDAIRAVDIAAGLAGVCPRGRFRRERTAS